MIIHFGLHLDGMQPALPETAIGEVTLGPSRLLGVLELRLGLPPLSARPAEALLAYQTCLAELDHDSRFYHRSFSVDALGVARTLLDWRAQWHEAGWTGTFSQPVSQRLADMAAIEALAKNRVPLTSGQRLQRVTARLAQGLNPQIDRVVLHDLLDALPAAWQGLLAHLNVEIGPGIDAPPASMPGTDLHRIQQTLLALTEQDEGTKRERERLVGDNSLIIVRGISRDLSAQAIGEYLLKTQALDDTVIIAERDGIIIDNALERVGMPRAGFQHYSRFRSVAQVLKLCLGLIWQPISPHLLLQFLIHPVGPLPDHVRSSLADAVADEPGVGGTAWRKALAKIEERMRTKFERSEKDVRALLDEIRYWLECERFLPGDGAPLATLIERTQRCTTWLVRRLRSLENPHDVDLFAAAMAQGEALIAALGTLHERGETRLGRIALERLVDEVGGRAADPGTYAEAGHVRATTEPASITQAWETVIWWDLATHAPSLSYPWSAMELLELANEGIALPSVASRIGHRMRGWLRPILSAGSQLVLVIHERDEGHHPLWSRLQSLFENFTEVRVEDALLNDSSHETIPALEILTDRLPLKPLPSPRRWWSLPESSHIPPRATESYSSLNKLIHYPHEWVLGYAARLRRGRAADLPGGNLLNGRLAHRLFESFFGTQVNWATLDPSAIRDWLAGYLPTLIEQEGALLCEAGSGVVREQVMVTLENAFTRLLGHLGSAGIESAAAEQWSEAPFDDVTLRGAIDLVLLDRQGREIVLDVKWSGEGYRGEELQENRYLQLATYAYMRRRITGADSWPYPAYFIVSTGNVLAHDTSVFPDAMTFPPPLTAESTAVIWARVSAAYDWRRRQIASNRIEVNAASTEPTAESVPPQNALATADKPDGFDEFTWLTGWEEGA